MFFFGSQKALDILAARFGVFPVLVTGTALTSRAVNSIRLVLIFLVLAAD